MAQALQCATISDPSVSGGTNSSWTSPWCRLPSISGRLHVSSTTHTVKASILSVPAEAACCCARVEAEACAGSSLTHRPCSLFFHVGASLPGGGGVDGACGMVNTGEDGAVEVEPTAPVAVRWRVTRNPCGSCERWLPSRAGGGVCDVHRSAKRCRVASSWTSALFPPRRVRSSSSGRGVAVVRLRGVAGAWAAAPALAARGVSPDLRPVGGRGVLGDLGLANIPRIGASGRANPSELPPRVGLSSKPKVDRGLPVWRVHRASFVNDRRQFEI
jgi:hypothetical protein